MKAVTVQLNSLVIKNLIDMGISPSRLGHVLVDSWYHQPMNNVLIMCNIDVLHQRINQLNSEIQTMDQKKALLETMKRELEVQEMLLDQSKNASMAFGKLQYLNKRIVYYKYDVDEIQKRHGDVIDEILTYDPNFDIDEHVERLKSVNAML